MAYCQYCGRKVDEDVVFCSECGRGLVGGDKVWQELLIQEKIDEAKHRANMRTISAIILVTVGMVAGGVLCVSSDAIGFFGVVFVCLGIGCIASAGRYELKARKLKKQLKP
ncbi:MAG: zinc-ribbon domain-containing protein [Dehalococcoidia bacterium]|nr:zinc-ribbon domain-containing protein [Dehalococcoidia bacterium]